MFDKTNPGWKVMDELSVGYRDQSEGLNPEISPAVKVETVSVEIDALVALRFPVLMLPELIVEKNPLCEKISVSTIVLTGTRLIVLVK